MLELAEIAYSRIVKFIIRNKNLNLFEANYDRR